MTKPVVNLCVTGFKATVADLVVDLIGMNNQTAVYDGSW
jgi:3-mercaptopyruvate sulfurtransferase SseA